MEGIDRISQLPDDVLIRILSLVPGKEVARTKSVSKTWRKLYEFLPSFTFELLHPSREFLLPPRSRPPEDLTAAVSSFIIAIDSALKLRKHFFLDKLRLCLDPDLIGSGWTSLVESWIDAALEKKVRDLHLIFPSSYPIFYPLPAKVFSARTITDLHLHGCRLKICENMNINIDLPALRKLCLSGIECADETVQKLISSCHLIQVLEILYCFTMKGLHVSGLANLQRLTVFKCYDLESIEIDAPSLRLLQHNNEGSPCDIVFLSSAEFLKELIIFDDGYVEDFSRSLGNRFPNLERLEIISRLPRIEISHHGLKALHLRLYRKKTIFKIDTPNLLSLSYRGYRKPLFSAISRMNTSSIREVDIKFFNYNFLREFSILQSKEYFKKMRHCQVTKLKLFIKSKQQLIVPAKLRPILSPPVYGIKHLRLAVGNCCRYQYIIDRMLWLCHPQTLSILPGSNPRFLKVLYNKFMNKEEHPKCCTSCTIKCWRHYLEEVYIDGNKSREEIDRIMEMLILSYTFIKCKVRFILKWRS